MSTLDSFVKKVSTANRYLANSPDRDRVMSIVQFIGMALFEPALAAGCPTLSKGLKRTFDEAAHYRGITRASQWLVIIPTLAPSGVRALIKQEAHPVTGILRALSTAFFSVYLLGEDIVLFNKISPLNPAMVKSWNRIRFVFLFYSNVLRTIANYLTYKSSTFDAAKDGADAEKAKAHKRKVLSLIDGVLQSIFCYGLLRTSVPAGPKYLAAALKSGDCTEIITSLAPPFVLIPFPLQGLIGIIASIPGFMMSVM